MKTSCFANINLRKCSVFYFSWVFNSYQLLTDQLFEIYNKSKKIVMQESL